MIFKHRSDNKRINISINLRWLQTKNNNKKKNETRKKLKIGYLLVANLSYIKSHETRDVLLMFHGKYIVTCFFIRSVEARWHLVFLEFGEHFGGVWGVRDAWNPERLQLSLRHQRNNIVLCNIPVIRFKNSSIIRLPWFLNFWKKKKKSYIYISRVKNIILTNFFAITITIIVFNKCFPYPRAFVRLFKQIMI